MTNIRFIRLNFNIFTFTIYSLAGDIGTDSFEKYGTGTINYEISGNVIFVVFFNLEIFTIQE